MVAYGKIYFEAQIYNQYIGFFPVYLGMALISTDFPTVHMVKTHFVLENL